MNNQEVLTSIEKFWRSRQKRTGVAAWFTRFRIWYSIWIGIPISICYSLYDLGAQPKGLPENLAITIGIAGLIGVVMMIRLLTIIGNQVENRTSLHEDYSNFQPLRQESFIEVGKMLYPLCQRMDVNYEKIILLKPRRSVSFSPSIVEGESGLILLIIPPQFLTIILSNPIAAEAMLAHELAHVAQRDTNHWLYASVFAEKLFVYNMPWAVCNILVSTWISYVIGHGNLVTTLLGFAWGVIPVLVMYHFFWHIRKCRRVSEELADLAAWIFTGHNSNGLKAAFELYDKHQLPLVASPADTAAPFGVFGEHSKKWRAFNIHPTIEYRLQKLAQLDEVQGEKYNRPKVTNYVQVGDAALATVIILLIVIVATVPVFREYQIKTREISSIEHLKNIGLGIMLYAQDHNEHYPSLKTSDSLQADLHGYVASDMFIDPVTNGHYILNSKLTGKSLDSIDSPSDEEIMQQERLNPDGTLEMLFADGHVMRIQPIKIIHGHIYSYTRRYDFR